MCSLKYGGPACGDVVHAQCQRTALCAVREANESLPEQERGSVLVIAKDSRVCHQLRSVIVDGAPA